MGRNVHTKIREGLRYFTMCEAEVQAVRGRYPKLTCLGALIVTAHEKWCRPGFITPLTVVMWICLVTAFVLEWGYVHP